VFSKNLDGDGMGNLGWLDGHPHQNGADATACQIPARMSMTHKRAGTFAG
jgi:hypothetical protein